MNERFDFDTLAKDLAGGLSRREALRRLGLGLAAGLFAELTGWLPAWPTARAEAAASVAPSPSLCFPEVVTKGSLTSWLAVSSTLEQAAIQTDCRFCLAAGQVCCGGQCCAPEACCNNVCVGLLSDPKNCGRCGNACGTGQRCANGFCVCSSDAGCAPPGPLGNRIQLLTCCSGVCTNLPTDPNNCGSCGNSCNFTLVGGQPVHLTCCSGVCVSRGSDPKNCGSCGNFCGAAQVCSNGVCCGKGLTGCGGACVNLANDVNNCGVCEILCRPGESCVNGHCTCGNPGTRCGAGQVCSNGACCPPGQTGCNGACANLQTDPNNCRFCGNACATTAANATPVCNAGVCGSNCIPGFTNCSGSCVNLQTDANNCGSCLFVCNRDEPGPTCCGGSCTNTDTDTHNCGECGHVCGSTFGIRHPCQLGNCIGG